MLETMDTRELIAKIRESVTVSLDRELLPRLLDVAETVRADDTGLAGWIRVLRVLGQIVVQEETPDAEVLVRAFPSRDAAERFVDQRLADYERMWDGCGCRIDYHA